MRLLVLCVYVRGFVGYTPDYVYKLRNMVGRRLARPHEFVTLTDRPNDIPEIECVPINSPDPQFPWWAKLKLFHRWDPLSSAPIRCLYLDLDSLIVAPLDPIVDYPSQFALVPHAGNWNGRGARQVVKRFNSSVMVWDNGVNTRLVDDWRDEVAERLWGDQDWIGERVPDADAMPLEWFPRLSELQSTQALCDSGAAKVVLCKVPKNAEAARRHDWVREVWQ